MPRCIRFEPHLTDEELYDRYRQAHDPVERSRWHFLWLLDGGMTAMVVSAVTGYTAYWIGQIVRRYTTDGPEGVRPLTNTVLANRHVATIDEFEDVQAARCVALQVRRNLIRSTILFHWWPQRMRKRQGPRRL